MKKITRRIAIFCAVLAALLFALFLLVYNGVILLNDPSAGQYPVRGVDVSSYQGEIDWERLSSQNISFAFIKATEGSSLVDRCFFDNYAQAQKTGLRIGAYHFFSYDSGGDTQAALFISTVEKTDGMLPPVIDLEFYDDYANDPPEQAAVREQLEIMLRELEAHYGMKPIIYATERSYSLYLAGGYEAYDIWIRDVLGTPRLSDGRRWTFWQYTDREQLEGYDGAERFIDMNVFDGTAEEFAQYAR